MISKIERRAVFKKVAGATALSGSIELGLDFGLPRLAHAIDKLQRREWEKHRQYQATPEQNLTVDILPVQ